MTASGPASLVTRPMREVAERFVELAIFAPVGLAVRAREELPALVESGRARAAARVDVARLIGRLAVQQGRQLLRQRVEADPTDRGAMAPDPTTPAAEEPSLRTVAGVDGAATPLAGSLAIDHYDSLAATQVVDLLPSLTATELDAVERYERAHRNRRTVTGKISQLRG